MGANGETKDNVFNMFAGGGVDAKSAADVTSTASLDISASWYGKKASLTAYMVSTLDKNKDFENGVEPIKSGLCGILVICGAQELKEYASPDYLKEVKIKILLLDTSEECDTDEVKEFAEANDLELIMGDFSESEPNDLKGWLRTRATDLFFEK